MIFDKPGSGCYRDTCSAKDTKWVYRQYFDCVPSVYRMCDSCANQHIEQYPTTFKILSDEDAICLDVLES